MSAEDYAKYQERLKKHKARVSAEIDAFIREAIKSRGGRAFIWWTLEIAGIGAQPFAPGHQDLTAFHCGELNVGQQILARLTEIAPEGYLTMMKENADARTSLANSDPTDSGPGSNSGSPGAFERASADAEPSNE